MLTAEAEAVKHLVEPSQFFKEQFGRANRFGRPVQESIRAFQELQRTVRTASGASCCGSECASVAARVLGVRVRDG